MYDDLNTTFRVKLYCGKSCSMKKDIREKRKILSSSIKIVLSSFENNVFHLRYRHQTSKACSS